MTVDGTELPDRDVSVTVCMGGDSGSPLPLRVNLAHDNVLSHARAPGSQ
jgi:hypothetical protein